MYKYSHPLIWRRLELMGEEAQPTVTFGDGSRFSPPPLIQPGMGRPYLLPNITLSPYCFVSFYSVPRRSTLWYRPLLVAATMLIETSGVTDLKRGKPSSSRLCVRVSNVLVHAML